MSAPITFTHGTRAWQALRIESEDKTKLFWQIRPALKGTPFPSAAEYQAARRHFYAIHGKTRSQNPRPRLVAAGNALLRP